MAGSSNGTSAMFIEEELKGIYGFNKDPNNGYIEVICGCSTLRLGDTMGKLRVSSAGKFEIFCECRSLCDGTKFTPYEFDKHSGRSWGRKWRTHIWVMINLEKVPLYKTVLLKYYRKAANISNGPNASAGIRRFHRDEFVKCFRCKKQRRFRLRTEQECRWYHDAVAMNRWVCAEWPFGKINCDSEEERTSRRNCRGCPSKPGCGGCTACVCFGCLKCRFADCNCRTCVDFIQNA